ncbi:MAG: hypothetical protein Q7J07_00855 [Pelolinea sp.]|nr:hypothetical protein [Pelolinea sp.]
MGIRLFWSGRGDLSSKARSRKGNLRPSKVSVGAENGDTMSDGTSSSEHDRVLAPHGWKLNSKALIGPNSVMQGYYGF